MRFTRQSYIINTVKISYRHRANISKLNKECIEPVYYTHIKEKVKYPTQIIEMEKHN